jgi:hypothetical protein
MDDRPPILDYRSPAARERGREAVVDWVMCLMWIGLFLLGPLAGVSSDRVFIPPAKKLAITTFYVVTPVVLSRRYPKLALLAWPVSFFEVVVMWFWN